MIAWSLILMAFAATADDAVPGGELPEALDGGNATSEAPAARPTLSIQPGTAKPGDPLLVTVTDSPGLPEGTLDDRPLHFYARERRYEAIAALSTDRELGETLVRVRLPAIPGTERVEFEASVEVVDPGFPRRELTVDKRFVSPSAAEKKRIAEDQAAFSRAWNQQFGPRLYSSNFQWPKVGVITAPFGDLRMFNGERKSQHYGTDLDGRVGDPVQAANDGVVVMSRSCFASGNTVILNHGGGLFTAYFHLSRIDVKEGDRVKQGRRLGLVGKTGRVTGPHLHWAVKADGLYVNGAALMQLDFREHPAADAGEQRAD